MLIEGVMDIVMDIADGGFAYTFFIALLGLAEPIRVGWDVRELQ